MSRAKRIGLNNEQRSVQWMLAQPAKYGIIPESTTRGGRLYSSRIEIAKTTSGFNTDLFSVVYKEEKIIESGKEKILYHRAGWDIITSPPSLWIEYTPHPIGMYRYSDNPEGRKFYDSEMFRCFFYYVQVKTNWRVNVDYLEALKNYKVPHVVKKELHIWNGKELTPTVIQL